MAGADEDALVGGGAHAGGLAQLDGAALLVLGRVPQTEEPVHRGPARESGGRKQVLCAADVNKG